MKSFSTLFAVLMALLALPLTASAEGTPTALWGKALQTKWTTQGSDIVLAADGGIYAVAGAGTKTDDVEEGVKFGNDKICSGTKYDGNSGSGNQMLVLSKIDKTGTVVWTVRSDYGEVGSQCLAPVPDGVICFFGMRNVDGYLGNSPVLIDAVDNEISINQTATDKRWYQGVVMKVSDAGIIQWVRIIDVDHTVGSQGIYPNDIVVDAKENIYICGNQRNQFTLKKSDNTDATIEARNVDGWDGDAQKSVGDLFVVKLDKDGYYQSHLQTSGTAEYVTAYSMDIKNDKIYLLGLVKGAAQAQISLGDKSLTFANANQALCTAAINTDLTVDWFKLYASAKTGGVVQTPKIVAGADYLWVMGKTNMQNIGGNTNITTSKTRDAMLLKVAPADGELLGGYMRGVNQSGFFAAFEGEDGYLYAATHTLLGKMLLFKLDQSTLSKSDEEWTLINNTSDTQGIAITASGLLYTMTRSNSASNYMVDDNTKTITQSVTKFSCNVCAFQLPVKPLVLSTEVTFNFADPNFRENIGTALADTQGFIYNETFTQDNVTLQITAGSAPSRIYTDTSRGQCLVTYKEYTTLTFRAPEGYAITQIEFTAAGNSNINNFTFSSGSRNGMVWTGNADGVRCYQGGTSYLASAVVTLAAKDASTTALPAIEYTECANIAAFNALSAGTYAKVTLTDAEVIGKSSDGYSTVWIQDATGGCWLQYTSLNDKLSESTKVNGIVYAVVRKTAGNVHMKEAEGTVNSSLTSEAISEYAIKEGTIAEVNIAANLNKVVKITGATLEETSGSVGTLRQGENTIAVNNGQAANNQTLHKIDDWASGTTLENVTIVAILVGKSTTANQLLPISITTTALGIQNISFNVNAENTDDVVIYNLQGVRLNSLQKGVNIVNGKKVVLK